MSNVELHLSHQPGGLEPSAFHVQLRRLDSLQALMKQGGCVVGEVAQFLVRAREELSAFQREQETCAGAQELVVAERDRLVRQVAEQQRELELARLQVKEQEALVSKLSADLAKSTAEDSAGSREHMQELSQSRIQLAEAADRIESLEAMLKQERLGRESSLEKARDEGAARYAHELAQLKNRISALEQQLASERDRRSRLMEVVRTHDVTVNGSSTTLGHG